MAGLPEDGQGLLVVIGGPGGPAAVGVEDAEGVQRPGFAAALSAAAPGAAPPANTAVEQAPTPTKAQDAPKGAPAIPGAQVQPAASAAATAFMYGTGYQFGTADGLFGNVSIARPSLASGDFHSLAELAAESGDGQQIVEVGWTVVRGLNGDANPRLFVYHWVDGAASRATGGSGTRTSGSATSRIRCGAAGSRHWV